MVRESPPPSPTRSSSSAVVLCVLLVPLVVVSLVVFSVDSGAPAAWSSQSSSFSSSSTTWRSGGGGGGGGDPIDSSRINGGVVSSSGEGQGGGGEFVSNSSGQRSHMSLPPVAAPSPAPEPADRFSEESESEDAVSPPPSVMRTYAKLEKIELGLAKARSTIREAARNQSQISPLPDRDYVPQGPIYRNAYAFHRSYQEMEKSFRVYVYEEGEPPLFHDGPCKDIYSMEGRFIYNMEMENRLRTRDPDRAHVHFLPFSVTKMVKFVYQPNSYDLIPLKRTVADYIDTIARKHPYWNRSLGADHFMLSCHDWGPHASHATPSLYSNSIRVLCNANTSEGFDPSKDVSLPEVNLKTGVTTGMIGGPSASHRPILAFFAGGMHGPIRPALLKHWKDKDPEVRVHEYLPKGVSYYDMMKRSRYCICPSGYEVASPRIVEAIYLECVPVVISDHYALPFGDVLNWRAFSVQVSVEDIPSLKRILTSISSRQYIRMQRRVRMVRRHFVVTTPPKRFDVFHMILHSVWLRRLNVRVRPPPPPPQL